MLSRLRGNKDKSKRHSFDLPALQVRHVDGIRYLWKLSRSLQALKYHLELELPKLVLLGGSIVKQVLLLECLTGLSICGSIFFLKVKLPPEFEHDQRVPIEFRLTNMVDGDWTCRIKIRREYKMQNTKKIVENVEETTLWKSSMIPENLKTCCVKPKVMCSIINTRLRRICNKHQTLAKRSGRETSSLATM